MLLTRLYEHSFRLQDDTEAQFSPPMYARERVRWYIELDEEGKLQGTGFTPLTGEGKRPELGKFLDIPALPKMRGIALAAKLLADNGQYVLGLAPEGKKAERAEESHRMFVDLVRACAAATAEPAVLAVAKFYEHYGSAELELPAGFDPSQNITFRVRTDLPIDLPSVQRWWAEHAATGTESRAGVCSITGQTGSIIERLPQPIKGIPEGQVTGVPLVSMNAEAFESYGLTASYNAPISLDAAERIGKTLNWLLADDKHHLRIGQLVYVFWTREPSDLDVLSFFNQPDVDHVKLLIESDWRGSKYKDAMAGARVERPELAIVDPNRFYAAALSASGSRVVIRDWVETTVGNAKRNLARWFMLQELCDPYGEAGRPLGVYALTAGMFRDMNQENPKLVARCVTDFLHAALAGGIVPDYIVAQALRRTIAEQGVNQPRARLLKLWLLSQDDTLLEKEHYMTELESANREPAYLCGRMLAVLEAIQRLSIPGAKATVLDRYYGTASSAPASIFGTLLRGAQPHLAKLRKTRPAAYMALSERLEEISLDLVEFPRTLTLKQQALFSLGYYHQRGHDRAQAKKHKELKDLAETGADADTNNPEEKE
jgi:CRISPR-associated protein Csd1